MDRDRSLTVRNLAFSRSGRRILAQINLGIRRGEIACLIGPNGSGKSTLLRCIAGALMPDSGQIQVEKQNILRIPAVERAQILSYAPQETRYSFAFTVREFVGMTHIAPTTITPHTRHFAELIEMFDLVSIADRSLLTLSGGERQRAAVARALAQETPFVLLDEPTAHLDLQHQKLLIDMLRKEAKEHHRGILLVLHDLNLASIAADCLYLLQEGIIVATGTSREVLTEQNIQSVYKTRVRILDDAGEIPTIILAHSDFT
jgi:iron complex transport system ATP-binding protein